jgi:hypothetical protein
MYNTPQALYGVAAAMRGEKNYSRLSAALMRYISARQSLSPFGAPLVALAPFMMRHALSTAELGAIIDDLWMRGAIVQAVPHHFAVVARTSGAPESAEECSE